MSKQLTLNNSNEFQVVVNTKTGKFYRGKYNPKTRSHSDYSWTDKIRLADKIRGCSAEKYISSLKNYCNLKEEVTVKTYQLQYVEIK